MNIVFLEMNEAANFLRIAKSTLYKKVMRKEIPFHKLGNKTLFNKEELVHFIYGNLPSQSHSTINEFDLLTLPSIR
jgi:excisionase family DNA binding protein